MKTLLTLVIFFTSAFAVADWEEQQKQNQAEKVFKVSTTDQAIKNPKFFKKWPTEKFVGSVEGVNYTRYSSTHDDCISGDTYYGGWSPVCVLNEEVYENEEGDGEPGEWKKVCVQVAPATLTKAASQAPTSVKVIFYRAVAGVSSDEQTSSEYRVGSREVAIPKCK